MKVKSLLRNRIARKFVAYFIVGGSAAIVDVSIFYLLYQSGMPVFPSAATGAIIAVCYNYVLLATIVYGVAAAAPGRFLLFAVWSALGIAVNSTATTALIGIAGLPALLSKAIAIGSVFVINFIFNTFVTFKSDLADGGKP